MNSAITERDKRLLYMLLFVVIIFLFGWCLIRPLYKKISDTSRRIEDASSIRAANEAKLIGLSSAEAVTAQFSEELRESTKHYYNMMNSSEIDRLVTMYILEHGLTARSLTITMPDEAVSESPYLYSELQTNVSSVSADTDPVSVDTDNDITKTSKDGHYFYDAVLSFLTRQEGSEMVMVSNPTSAYSEALNAVTTSDLSRVYCVKLDIIVEGDEETEQMIIDDLFSNPSLRLTRFNWIPMDPITYLQEDGTVLIYENDNKLLSFSVNLYMTDINQ